MWTGRRALLLAAAGLGLAGRALAETMMKVQTPTGLALTWIVPTSPSEAAFSRGVQYRRFELGNPRQQWIRDTAAKTIRTADGWCLSASKDYVSNIGSPVVLLTRCVNGDTLQQWELEVMNVLLNVRHQLCLDAHVSSPGATEGTVQVYGCNRGAPSTNNQWLITPILPGYYIAAADSAFSACLDLDGGRVEAGTSVGAWACDTNKEWQRWVYNPLDGSIRYAARTDLCLDAVDTGESTRVSTWWCDPVNANRRFDLVVSASGTGYTTGQLQLRHTRSCLQVQGHELTIAKCESSATSQIFKLGAEITPALRGYYIAAADSAFSTCLDLDSGRVEAGTNVGAWACDTNKEWQRWVYDPSDGSIRYAARTDLCLDAADAGESTSGVRVSTWWCDPVNANRRFDLVVSGAGADFTRGQLQLRNTKWCLQTQGNALMMAKCAVASSATSQIFQLGAQLLVPCAANLQCKNGAVCVRSACQCKDGWAGAQCETATDRLVGLETSDGFLATVAGASDRDLTFDVPQATQKVQQFRFNPVTKRLRAPDRWFCVRGGAGGNDAALTACDDATEQQWTYDITTGTIKQSGGADVCLESTATHKIKAAPCSPTTKPGQVWLVDENIYASEKLIRHRAVLSSCLVVDNGALAVKTCDLQHREWRHDATYGEAQLRVGELCVQSVVRSATSGSLTMGACDARTDRTMFEYDTATGLVRAFQTNLCVSLDAAAAKTLALAACNAQDAKQHWFIPRRDQCGDPDFLQDMKNCGADAKHGACAFNGCQCAPGFSGKRCEYETCSTTQCNNGGTCARGKCTCADGFAGTFCDDFVKCQGVACRHGGTCNEAGKCACPVGFSGDKCEVVHPKVLLRVLGHRAVGVDGGRVVVVEPNARTKDHVWWWDSAKQMLRSVGRPTYCLERSATGDALLGTCDDTRATQHWQYAAASGALLTQDARAAVRFEQLVAGAGLRVVVAETATTTALASADNDTTLLLNESRVDVDRLDLPGTPLRNADGKCLATTQAGALSFQDCDPDADTQQWKYLPQNGLVRTALLDGFMCLSLDAGVTAQRCDGDDARQAFRYDYATQRFRNRKSLQCVSPAGSGLVSSVCESAAPLHAFIRSVCDVINLCGDGTCVFERCACPAGLSGPFCSTRLQ